MSNNEMLIVLYQMQQLNLLCNSKRVFKSEFDGSIQFHLSEYEKAVNLVQRGVIPLWLKEKIDLFQRSAS